MTFYPLSPQNNAENCNKFAEYELRYRLCQLFSHGWDFILKETPESNWKTVKKFNLTEQKLWYKYTDSEQVVGVRFPKETRHGLYDIDWGSIYDPREQEESLRSLQAQLELWGIFCFVLLQSSSSQGLHLCFFLDRPVNTFRLACVMNKAAEDAGLEIKRGQLETFPNTKRYNSLFNGHRLPLQQGSYLLDKDYTPYSDRLEHFLNAADWSAARNDTDLLESRLEEAYEWFKAKKNTERVYNPTPEDKDFIEQVDYAQREIKEGFLNQIRIAVEQGYTGDGETNDLLLTIAKLGRIYHGLSGQRYIDYIKETVMSCPGYAIYCHHKHEIDRRCAEVARYGEKHWYPYRFSLPQNRATYKQIKESLTNKTNLNLERQYNAQNRIIQAVVTIKQERGKLPNKVGECKLAIRNVTKELFGMSISDATLRKPENLPLWHPKYRPVEIKSNSESVIEPITSVNPDIILDVTEPEVKNNNPNKKEPNNKIVQLPTSEDSIPKAEFPEFNISPETPAKTEAGEAVEPSSVVHKALQLEQPNNNQYEDCATPNCVIRQNDQKRESLKTIPGKYFQVLCHTLALMKGMLPDLLIEIFYQLFQRVYCEAVIKKRDLVFIFNGYKFNGTSGFVEKKGINQTKLESILLGTQVKILRNQFHSSYLRDNPNQILVYIRPVLNSDDWKGGIAVPLEQLSLLCIENKKNKIDPTSEI